MQDDQRPRLQDRDYQELIERRVAPASGSTTLHSRGTTQSALKMKS